MKAVVAVAVCCMFLASCAPPAPDLAKVRQEVEALMAKAEQDMLAGTMDTTLAQYTDDAVSMPNYGPLLKGKPAIKEYYVQMMAMGFKFTTVDFVTTDVMVGGQYVYEIGTYTMTIQMPGMPDMPDNGKYITVYERMADGSLKIKAETWNTNRQPPMPEHAS